MHANGPFQHGELTGQRGWRGAGGARPRARGHGGRQVVLAAPVHRQKVYAVATRRGSPGQACLCADDDDGSLSGAVRACRPAGQPSHDWCRVWHTHHRGREPKDQAANMGHCRAGAVPVRPRRDLFRNPGFTDRHDAVGRAGLGRSRAVGSAVTRSYYRGAAGALMVYDITR